MIKTLNTYTDENGMINFCPTHGAKRPMAGRPRLPARVGQAARVPGWGVKPGGPINCPGGAFYPIKPERIKIETNGYQNLHVGAFATSDEKMEVEVIIGQE